ncbi:hypothetical protein V9T40_001717 [Parthenolecanium corni]|uniref:WD repeat-containing protein 54 beta-propeller domain-containing protein n=1 Tax=Parthenolecanium corni TaxID=536013 RepID=A0AAN9Y3F6_9HEMI
MYKKSDYLLLPYSTSAVYHNLAVKWKLSGSGVEAAAVIHHDSVCIVPTSSKQNPSPKTRFIKCLSHTNDKNVQITQIAWGSLNYETVLIVTSTIGVQVFSQPDEECIYAHPCSDQAEKTTTSFARGIAVFNSMYFCIGNNAGSIRLFGPPNLDNEFCFIDRKRNHSFPIADLSAYRRNLASVDEEGYIMLWVMDTEELRHETSTASKSNCTGVKLKRDWLITIYASGCIRLYTIQKESTTNLNLSMEIAAHARAITALDVSENNEYLLTTSEDTYVKIWQLYKDGNLQKLKHFENILVADNMLMGGKFSTPNGSRFLVTSYDSNVISCFSM